MKRRSGLSEGRKEQAGIFAWLLFVERTRSMMGENDENQLNSANRRMSSSSLGNGKKKGPSSSVKRSHKKVALLTEHSSTRKLLSEFERVSDSGEPGSSETDDVVTAQRFAARIDGQPFLIRVLLSRGGRAFVEFFDMEESRVVGRSPVEASWFTNLAPEGRHSILTSSEYFVNNADQLYKSMLRQSLSMKTPARRPRRAPPPPPPSTAKKTGLDPDLDDSEEDEMIRSVLEEDAKPLASHDDEWGGAQANLVLQRRIEKFESLNEKQQQRIEQLEQENKRLAEMMHSQNSNEPNQQDACSNPPHEESTKQHQLEVLQVKHMDILMRNEQLEKELERFASEAEAMLEEAQEAGYAEVARLQDQVKTLQIKLSEETFIREELETKHDKLKGQLTTAQRELETEREQAKTLGEQLEESKSGYVAQKEYGQKLKSVLNGYKETAENQYAQLEGKHNQLEQELEEMRQESLKLGVEKDEKAAQLEEINAKLQEKSRDLAQAQSSLKELTEKFETVSTGEKEARSALSQAQAELGQLKAESHGAQSQLIQLREQVDKADEVNAQQELELRESETVLKRLEAEYMAAQAAYDKETAKLHNEYQAKIHQLNDNMVTQTRIHYEEKKQAKEQAQYSKVKLVDTMAELEDLKAQYEEMSTIVTQTLDTEDELAQKLCEPCKQIAFDLINARENKS